MIINDIPDWQETTEISDGMFRKIHPSLNGKTGWKVTLF